MSAVAEAKVKPPNGVRRPSRFGRSSAYAGPVAAQQATTTGNQSPAVVAGGNVAINYGMSSEEREAFAKQVAEKLLAAMKVKGAPGAEQRVEQAVTGIAKGASEGDEQLQQALGLLAAGNAAQANSGRVGVVVWIIRLLVPSRPGGSARRCRGLDRCVQQAERCLPILSRECRNQAGWVGSRLLERACGTEFCGAGRGFQPAMVRAQARACAVSVIAGNSRRNSTAADSSPRCSKAARITAASASVTTIMPAGWVGTSKTASSHNGLPLGGGERDLLAEGRAPGLKVVFAGSTS